MIVTVVQTHRADVEETSKYEVADEHASTLADLDEAEREEFVLLNGDEVDHATEITKLHETFDVTVTW